MKSLNRRSLLRGAGGVALALPFLQAMGDPSKLLGFKKAFAGPAGFPKRIIFVTSSNGCIRGYKGVGTNRWSPTGTPTAFDLTASDTLKPLAPNAANVLLIDGFDNRAGGDADGLCLGNPHNKITTQLTVTRYETSAKSMLNDAGGGTVNCKPYLTAGGISVDQELANRLMGQTKFPNIMMYTGPNPKTFYQKEGFINGGLGTIKLYASWKGKDQPVIGEFDPTKSFNTIFGGGVPAGGMVDNTAQIARDKSILDAALESYTGLGAKVGADDKSRLDAHADAIRTIENQLADINSHPALTCTSPTAPAAADVSTPSVYPQTIRVQADMMVAAMACDLTRVGMIEWEPGFSELVHTWLGINREHHGISHDTAVAGPAAAAIENIVKINNYYAGEMNYLIDKLKSMPEGGGTMLDNTAVVWLRELGDGASHDVLDQAWVIGGTGGGYFKNNLWYKPNAVDKSQHGNLIVHFLRMFGFPDTTFGDPKYNVAPMTGMTTA